ncbi:Macrophage killing protein with similarity to conjugation protein [Legionella adelaidensis]|uniref:Macrophage killing protein with similarity to conjugation protein n=1 Tax=Legionella adelaidensis TaxID=45056 RepID=A0A0W0R2P7_9GAMM|nr:DotI/IcmL/TraM family protein [Legionella adelaidensis]KTC65262.1 Macrophage killing protein with similarity to conjugation protein [Legionella adelaidensis]
MLLKRTLGFCTGILLFFLSSLAHSDDNAAIIQWTQQTLLQALSVSYEELQSKTPRAIKANFTQDGWEGMTTFFANYIQEVVSQKLSLHPVLIGNGAIVKSGIVNDSNFFDGIPYWLVTQTLTVPELSLTIDFAVIVIKTSSNRYLIQSLNINERTS